MLRWLGGHGCIGTGQCLYVDMISRSIVPRGVSKVERTTYVAKLAIFEEQEIFPPRYLNKPFNGLLGKVVNDVGMSLEDADAVADILCQSE